MVIQSDTEIDNDRIVESALKGVEYDKLIRRSERNEQMWMTNLNNQAITHKPKLFGQDADTSQRLNTE